MERRVFRTPCCYCLALCSSSYWDMLKIPKPDASDKLKDPISCVRIWSLDCLLWGSVPAWRVHRDITEIWHATVILVIWQVKGHTLRQMVFISLSAVRLQGNLWVVSRRLWSGRVAARLDGIFPPIEVKGHRREWVALRLKTKQELVADVLLSQVKFLSSSFSTLVKPRQTDNTYILLNRFYFVFLFLR